MTKKRKPHSLGNPALIAMASAQMADRQAQGGGASSAPPMVILTEKDRSLMRKIVSGGIIIIGGMIAWAIIRRNVRAGIHKGAINNSDDTSKPEHFALQIYNAMGSWWDGTDEDMIRRTIQEVPHKRFWEDVKRSYFRISMERGSKGTNLMDDLRGEVSASLLRELTLILQELPDNQHDANNYDPNAITPAKVDAWAERIYQASEGGGTDEDAIKAALRDIPTIAAFCSVNKAYQKKYGYTALAEIADELSDGLWWSDLTDAYNILTSKPDVNGRSIQQITTACG